VALAFGWNAFVEGAHIDWQLVSHSTTFVYLGADSVYLSAEADARRVKLWVGPYWSLTSADDPEGQAKAFLDRCNGFTTSSLPPAVFLSKAEHLPALKRMVEALEKAQKKRVLIGGTPKSLKRAGLIFGRSNPLWISHKPVFGGPTIPVGWESFAVWQTETSGQVKGVDSKVGYNGAQDSFLDPGKTKRIAVGLGALAVVGVGLYLSQTTKKKEV